MGVLARYADMFRGLADANSRMIDDWGQQRPPEDSPGFKAWDTQNRILITNGGTLRNLAEHFYDKDIQVETSAAKPKLEEVEQATKDAEKTIAQIAAINKFLALAADVVNVGVAIMTLIADPVAGAKAFVSSVSDLVDAVKDYDDKKHAATKQALVAAVKRP